MSCVIAIRKCQIWPKCEDSLSFLHLKSDSLLYDFLAQLFGSVAPQNRTIPPTVDRGVSDTSTRGAETRGGEWVGGGE